MLLFIFVDKVLSLSFSLRQVQNAARIICFTGGDSYEIYAKKYKDDNSLHDVISYCGRLGKASYTDGIGVYPPNAVYEMVRMAQSYGQARGVRLRHWVLSFSKEEVRKIGRKARLETLKRFGWYAASYYGGQYQIVFAIHLDSDNPHIHFVMSTVNYRTGKKYPGDKADYYGYQRYLQDFFSCCGMILMAEPDQPPAQISQGLDG